MKRNMKGSASRDEFKRRHKDLAKTLYACDIDFVFVEKEPFPDIVAAIDYKTDDDDIQFSEVIAYNALLRRGIDVYIVQGDCETGRFAISRYVGGHHEKPRYELELEKETENWGDFERWEFAIRSKFRNRFAGYH